MPLLFTAPLPAPIVLAMLLLPAPLALVVGVFVVVYTRRLEELRQQNARKERQAMLERVADPLLHELRRSLSTIVVASQDLAEVSRELGSGEGARLAGMAKREAQRASHMIGQVRASLEREEEQPRA